MWTVDSARTRLMKLVSLSMCTPYRSPFVFSYVSCELDSCPNDFLIICVCEDLDDRLVMRHLVSDRFDMRDPSLSFFWTLGGDAVEAVGLFVLFLVGFSRFVFLTVQPDCSEWCDWLQDVVKACSFVDLSDLRASLHTVMSGLLMPKRLWPDVER